jgi:hypothetical protein
MKKWSETDIILVKENYNIKNKEWFLNEFKNKYTWTAIKEMARKLGVIKKNNKRNPITLKWTKDLIEEFKDVWVSGCTEEINEKFKNFSYEALTSAAKRFKVKRDENFKFNNKLNILLGETNINYYWLGFIMADGCFGSKNDLKVSLSVKDLDHLTKLSNYLNVNINIYNGLKYGKYTSKDSCNLSVMDVITIPKILDKFKIEGKKTYTACSLNCLDTTDKFLSFFCGFVDGDGCITTSKNNKVNMLRIQCHESWLNNLEIFGKRLNELFGFNFKCYIDKNGYAKFAMYRYKELVILKNEIDKLEIPYLERKWLKIK